MQIGLLDWFENVPGGHDMHSALELVEYIPKGHAKQSDCAVLASPVAYVPATHEIQAAALFAPTVVLYLPMPQAVQLRQVTRVPNSN